MTGKFNIICNFNGQQVPFTFFIGDPKDGNNPVQNQNAWLQKERGGSIDDEAMASLTRIQKLSKDKGISLEKLCALFIEEGYGAAISGMSASEGNALNGSKSKTKAKEGSSSLLENAETVPVEEENW